MSVVETLPAGFVCLENVKPRDIRFLWRPYLGRGKVTMIEGDPGTLKSYSVISIAAAVTTGAELPGGSRPESGNVLLLSGEDGLADTVRPRLDVRGADVARVFTYSPSRGESDAAQMLERLDLAGARGVQRLREAVEKIKPALIVVDPVTAFMGLCQRNDGGPVRQFLAPLADIAEQYDAALLLSRHFNKNAGHRAIYRGGGAIDFGGVCRSVLQVGVDPETEGGFVLAHTKSNIGPIGPSVRYRYVEGEGIVWGDLIDITADELVSDRPVNAIQVSRIKAAEKWLRRELDGTPRLVADLKVAATSDGHSWATVRRARFELPVRTRQVRREDKIVGWEWRV